MEEIDTYLSVVLVRTKLVTSRVQVGRTSIRQKLPPQPLTCGARDSIHC